MTADALGELADRLVERMHVLRVDLLGLLVVEPAVRTRAVLLLERDLERIVLHDALRARDELDARVRTRRADVVLDEHRLAHVRADERRVHVARLHRLGEARIVLLEVVVLVQAEVDLTRVHRDEVVHLVAAVDVHRQAERHEAVRTVAVARVVAVVRIAPVLVVGIVLEAHVAQVVNVRALAVDDVAKHAELRQVEGEHLDLAVAAVLELHAVALRLLALLNELPTLVDAERARDFGEDVLAAVHRREGDRDVKLPRGRVVDDVDVRIVAKRLPRLVAKILLRGRLFGVRQTTLGLLDLLRVLIADRRHGDAREPLDALHHALATTAHAHDAKLDLRNRRRGVTVHRRTFRAPEKTEEAAGFRRTRTRSGRTGKEGGLQKAPTIHIHIQIPFLCV